MVVLTKDGRVRLMAARAHRWLVAYFGQIKGESLPEALRDRLRHQEANPGPRRRRDGAPLRPVGLGMITFMT